MKKCNKCNIEKPLDGFHKHKPSKNGISARCKVCRKKYEQTPQAKANNRKSHSKNSKKVNEHAKAWRNKVQGVYGIFENGECLYVGESSMVNNRLANHKYLIKNPEKSSTHSSLYYKLQQHNHLILGVVEECDNHKERERHFIDMYNPMYNA